RDEQGYILGDLIHDNAHFEEGTLLLFQPREFYKFLTFALQHFGLFLRPVPYEGKDLPTGVHIVSIPFGKARWSGYILIQQLGRRLYDKLNFKSYLFAHCNVMIKPVQHLNWVGKIKK